MLHITPKFQNVIMVVLSMKHFLKCCLDIETLSIHLQKYGNDESTLTNYSI